MFTLITTYYNNPELLQRFIKRHKDALDYNIIIVDDGSLQFPAYDILKEYRLPHLQLLRVVEDIGFNSHGARNLAMQQTTTKWNALVDIDYELINPTILSEVYSDLDESVPHFFPVSTFKNNRATRQSVNDFFVTKETYWKAGGYDTEFTAMHFGDRLFIGRMVKKSLPQVIYDGCYLQEITTQRATLVKVDSEELIEVIDRKQKKMFFSTAMEKLVVNTRKQVSKRWKENIMCDPTPFKWERQI